LSHAVPPKASLWPILFRIDESLRDAQQKHGCVHCGGRLDRADYRRKPRGGPDALDDEDALRLRLSLCCAAEGCRRRTAPPSARFLGRRIYLGVIVTLVAALQQGATPTRVRKLTEVFGADRRTIERWRRWWRDEFASSAAWRLDRGRFPFSEEPVPRRLVVTFEAFEDPTQQARLMSHLAPHMAAAVPIPEGARPVM